MATDLHAVLTRHPWLVQAFGSHLLYGQGKARQDDHSLAVFEAAGFTGAEAAQAAATVFTLVLGNALGQAAGDYGAAPENTLEFGIQAILDGLDARLAAGRMPADRDARKPIRRAREPRAASPASLWQRPGPGVRARCPLRGLPPAAPARPGLPHQHKTQQGSHVEVGDRQPSDIEGHSTACRPSSGAVARPRP